MTQTVTTYMWVVLMWFAVAILAEVFSTVGFAFWLHRRGVKLVFGLTGIPGYVEYRYAEWCKARGKPSRRVVAIRVLLMINVIAALLFAFPILSGS